MYCIRDDYQENPRNETLDSASGKTYWSPWRIRASSHYQIPVYRVAQRLACERQLKTVLDVGCGVATKLDLLFGRQFEIYGVDQDAAIQECRRRFARGTFFVDNLESPSPSDVVDHPGFDLVICADVIEHLVNPDILLDYIRRQATRRSYIVISTPDRDMLLGSQARRPSNRAHIREWSFAEFSRYLIANGFRIEQHQRLLPSKIGLNSVTCKFLLDRLTHRLRWKTCQVVICRTS